MVTKCSFQKKLFVVESSGGGKAQGVGIEGIEGCWWLGERVECTHGQGVYLFEYVDSWGVKDPLCMTRATRVGEVKESKKKEIEFHVLTYLKGDCMFAICLSHCLLL